MQPTSAGKPSLDHESLRQFPVSEREIDLLTVESSCPNLRSSLLTMVVTATTTTTGKRVDRYHINTPAWCFWLSSFTFDLVPVDEPDADSMFSPSSSPWDHSMAPLSAAAKELVYFPLRQHEQVSADTQGTRDRIIFRRQACWKLHEQSHATSRTHICIYERTRCCWLTHREEVCASMRNCRLVVRGGFAKVFWILAPDVRVNESQLVIQCSTTHQIIPH